MVKLISLATLALASVAIAKPTVYLIRHGEKPDSGNGLSTQGLERAQCLRTVFGASSEYNIGHIMAQTPLSSTSRHILRTKEPCMARHDRFLIHFLFLHTGGKRQRPYDTVEPLAEDLGLTVDVSCDRDDPGCVKDVVDGYTGSGNILICWEHDALTDIVSDLGDKNAPDYPDDRYVEDRCGVRSNGIEVHGLIGC